MESKFWTLMEQIHERCKNYKCYCDLQLEVEKLSKEPNLEYKCIYCVAKISDYDPDFASDKFRDHLRETRRE
jgi:aspartate carbamoyltransferase regulatory subunit